MSVSGSPDAWVDLLEQLLPELLELVIDTWSTLQRPLKDNREDTVTEALCRALRHNRTLRDMPIYVMIQMVELDPALGEELGRLDIAFLPSSISGSPNESIYFCLECKRLNVNVNGKRRPGGSEYVQYGMLRFVIGQYAKAVRHGGMVGYVLDGDVASAIANVKDNIRNQCVTLYMESPGELRESSILNHISTAKETFHHRKGDEVSFRVHHLFFAAADLF